MCRPGPRATRRQVEAARLRPPYGLDPGVPWRTPMSSSSGPGLAGLVADGRAGRRRPPGAAGRPGAGGQPRRAGVLVLRRAVPRRLPRAAPDGRQGLPRPGLAGLDGHRRVRPATRTSGRGAGPRPTSSSPPGRSGPGCASTGLAVLPGRRLGRARRRPGAAGTATRCRASTSPGAPGRACVEPFERRVREPWRAGRCRVAVPPPGRRADRHRGGAVDGRARHACSAPARRRARRAHQPRRDRRLRAARRRR